MSFRTSFILLVLVAVVGGYVLIFELQRQPQQRPEPPFFYDVQPEAIARVSIPYQGQPQVFVKKNGVWQFEASGDPVDSARWSGMTLLLSGPRAARVLKPQFDNPSEYGLEPPETTIALALEGGQPITILMGHKTPDELSNYAQVVGFAQLLLVSSAWGDVINRLVTEPPVVTPTPEGGVPPAQ